MGESTNGSDPIYGRMGGSTKRTYEYNHNNTHDNLTYYREWNGSESILYIPGTVFAIATSTVRTVSMHH